MTAPALTALLDELDAAHKEFRRGGIGAAAVALYTLPGAVPRLTAAIRAALALADELDAISDEHYAAYKHGDPSDDRRGSPYTEGFCVGYDSAAQRLRATIAAALEEKTDE